MRPKIILAVLCSAVCAAQITIEDGTKLRVRLEKAISSATADEGQSVELSVTEDVKVGGVIVIPEGARVAGTITEAMPKRRMGRAGKLDFSIDKVRAIDGEWIPLRYSLQKKSGSSHAVRTGIITAGIAIAFWPAAPVMLLMKGKDVVINKGIAFDVFTDSTRVLKSSAPSVPGPSVKEVVQTEKGQAPTPSPEVVADSASGTASVTILSSIAGADIEIDGVFVGSSPTTIQMKPGLHVVVVKSADRIWQRNLQISAGSNVTLNAAFPRSPSVAPKN